MICRLFYALLAVGLITAQIQSCQDSSFCQNGGTCLINSVSPAAKRCHDDEVFNFDSCYSFVRSPLRWNDASAACVDRGGSLALPQTDDDQRFLASYIQGIIAAGLNLDRATSGVWLTVRSKVNGSFPAWVSYPGSFLVNNLYWKSGEPNLYPDWNDVCVSLQSDTLYFQWETRTCDTLNYGVCQRRLNSVDVDEALPQCSCPPGFVGQKCETQTSCATCDSSSLQQVICASQPLSFSCPNGGTIVVDYASYGAVAGYRCSGTSSTGNLPLTCSNSDSLQTLVNRCQGMPYCDIPDVSALFPETTCTARDELQLQYRMRCVDEVKANCPSGAFYMSGRCYSISFDSKGKNQLTQKEASEKCRLEGGQLPTSLSQLQEDEIVRQASRQSKNAQFWIGLILTPAGPAWTDGNQVSYTPPGSDLTQPLGCTVLSVMGDGSGRWVSASCDSKANYICQFAPNTDDRPKQRVPVQTTTPGQVFKGSGE